MLGSFANLGKIMSLVQNLEKSLEQLRENIKNAQITTVSDCGMVSVKASGDMVNVDVSINQDMLHLDNPNFKEALEAATANAIKKMALAAKELYISETRAAFPQGEEILTQLTKK